MTAVGVGKGEGPETEVEKKREKERGSERQRGGGEARGPSVRGRLCRHTHQPASTYVQQTRNKGGWGQWKSACPVSGSLISCKVG